MISVYILGSEADLGPINSLQNALQNNGYSCQVDCPKEGDKRIYEDSDIVIIWMSQNPDKNLIAIAESRKSKGKVTLNVFAQPFALSDDARKAICRNQSVYSSLQGSDRGSVIDELLYLLGEIELPQPETPAPQVETTPTPAPAQPAPTTTVTPSTPIPTEPQAEPAIKENPQTDDFEQPVAEEASEPKQKVEEPVQQPLISQNVEYSAPVKEEKKSNALGWIILIVVVALIGYFLNWWNLPFLPDRGDSKEEYPAEQVEAVEDNHLSESQLINLIQLANKKQSVALTPSFAKTIEQYDEAPNVVWEGGIYKPDPSPELLVEQPEPGNILSVEILDQTYSEDGTQGEIVFEYFTQSNGYESPHRKAVVLIYNEDGNWRIYEFGMDATNYGNEPTYYLSRHMSTYITDANYRVQSGETFRDLNLMFSESPETIEEMTDRVRAYAEKYDVTIPDSLTYYFYIETPTEEVK